MNVVEVSEDICIACGTDATVPAFLYARYPSGVTAAFCGSHGHQHLERLIADGAEIIDRTHLLHEVHP